jgi:hypothetical protein
VTEAELIAKFKARRWWAWGFDGLFSVIGIALGLWLHNDVVMIVLILLASGPLVWLTVIHKAQLDALKANGPKKAPEDIVQ